MIRLIGADPWAARWPVLGGWHRLKLAALGGTLGLALTVVVGPAIAIPGLLALLAVIAGLGGARTA